jgi:hypothetical protein
MQPELIVVVDTQPPDISLRFLPPTVDGKLVECKVTDANLSVEPVQVEYQAADKSWKPLAPLPENPAVFRLPVGMPEPLVRAIASDRAGNTATRLLNPAGPTVTSVSAAPPPPLGGSAVAFIEAESRADKRPLPPALPAPVSPARQLLNGTHVTLEYQIEHQGPTGVSKVEVWYTRDNGLSWQRLTEDPDQRSPVEFDLPGEGVYGVSLVLTNGSGLGGTPPAKGEAPDYWVEVDLTRPVAQLLSVRPGRGADAGTLQITWTAADKNLGATPVDLYYTTQRGGMWQPIVRGVKNDGNYRWPLPRDVGPEFFIRLDVTDQAGNIARCETPQPVVVDLARPKARVLSVTVGAPRLPPPTGN